MRLFRRDHTPPPHDLGTGTSLTVVTLDGRPLGDLAWTRDARRVLDHALPALRVLRDAGIAGAAHVRSTPGGVDVDGVEVDVRLHGGGGLGVLVDASQLGFRLVVDDGGVPRPPTRSLLETVDGAEQARHEVVFAVSSLVAQTEDVAVGIPAPLTVTEANLQLLEATDDAPAQWIACVFLTRPHDVPPGADEDERRDLWVEHTVGVKVHLDGRVASDPLDDDPHGERSRTSLATASGWAGTDVDLLPCVRRLVERTEEVLHLRLGA